MKRLWYAFWMCWGMFCGVPCPVRVWDEEARPAMLCALPVLGGVIGGGWALAAWLCGALALPPLVRGAILCAVPWLLSGCIHLDGFLDCCDAIFSRRDLETRQRILKDRHVGSFAVIGMVLLALLQTALLAEAQTLPLLPLALLPAAVRACAAMAVTAMKKLGHSEYAGLPADKTQLARRLWFPAICLLLCIALPPALCGRAGLAPLAGAAGYGLAAAYASRQLGGISGDGSGFALTVGELCGVAALTLL